MLREGMFIAERYEILERNKIQVTVRREMGRDIDGACGQLRKRYMDDNTAKI